MVMPPFHLLAVARAMAAVCPTSSSAPDSACLHVPAAAVRSPFECSELCGLNSTLACISSEEESAMVARRWPGSILWLGAYKSRAVDQWQCASSGSLASHEYVNWGSGRPRPEGSCARVYNGEWQGAAGHWYASSCFDYPFHSPHVRCLCRHGSRPSAEYVAFATDHEEALLQARSRGEPWCGNTCTSIEYRSDAPHAPIVVHTVRGCCAANCYCTHVVGVYLALALPVLLGPIVLRRGGRRHPASSTRIVLLDVMSQLGMLLVIVGVTPTLLNNSDIPVLDVFGKKVRVHRFLGFVPVGISLVLLSLRPSLAEARYVVLAAFVFLAYAAVGIGVFLSIAFKRHRRSSDDSAISIERTMQITIQTSAQAFAHVVLFLSLLSLLRRRGGTLWRPTREVAAWRLRRLWSIYRVCMALMAAWSLVVVIAATIDPNSVLTNMRDKTGSDADFELLHAWSILVQGVVFSLLHREWRHRFHFCTRRMRAQTWRSSLENVGSKGGESTTEKLTAYLNEISVQLDPICQQSETSDAPSLVQWNEDPPRLGERLTLLGCGATLMKLGEGGFSVVVGAHLDGTPVALKVAKGGGKEQAPIKALRQEWLIMKSASFHHEHLATYIGTCLVAGCPALVLEHYEGGNLSDALGLRRPGSTRGELVKFIERWRLAPQLASGLSHLHSLGIIHCDIKASNVLLRPSSRHALGHAVLSDFGLAANAGSQSSPYHNGTWRYLAPEVTALENPHVKSHTCHAKDFERALCAPSARSWSMVWRGTAVRPTYTRLDSWFGSSFTARCL